QVGLATWPLAELDVARITAEIATEHGAQRAVPDLVAPLVVGKPEALHALAFGFVEQRREGARVAVQRHGPDVHFADGERRPARMLGDEGRVQWKVFHRVARE